MAHALHYSEVQKSSDYIVDVAQEMIRKRKEERKDPEYKRVCAFNVTVGIT